jgi:hypothetical protein
MISCTTLNVVDIQPDIQIVPVINGLRVTEKMSQNILKEWPKSKPLEHIGLYVGIRLLLD